MNIEVPREVALAIKEMVYEAAAEAYRQGINLAHKTEPLEMVCNSKSIWDKTVKLKLLDDAAVNNLTYRMRNAVRNEELLQKAGLEVKKWS